MAKTPSQPQRPPVLRRAPGGGCFDPLAGCESRAGVSAPRCTRWARAEPLGMPQPRLLLERPPSRSPRALGDSSPPSTCPHHLASALPGSPAHILFPMQPFPRVLLLWVLRPGRGSPPVMRLLPAPLGKLRPQPQPSTLLGGDHPRGNQTHPESEPKVGPPSSSLQNYLLG